MQRHPNDEVHGVAFLMEPQSIANLDKYEMCIGYTKYMVDMEAYDGRKLQGFVYCAEKEHPKNIFPTRRYMNVVIEGAKQAGLKPNYIEKLKAIPTYVPDASIIAKREVIPKPESLPLFTVEELAKHNGSTTGLEKRLSCLGYVIKASIPLSEMQGQDLTTYMLHKVNKRFPEIPVHITSSLYIS